MNESRIWRWSIAVAVCAGALAAWQSVQPVSAQRPAAAPNCCVATIDLNVVLESMDERKTREQELQEYIKAKQAKLEAMKKTLQQSQDDLKILPEKKKEWYTKRDEVAGYALALRGEEELAKAQVEEKRKLMSLELFGKIRDAAGRFAAEQGYAMVISSDSAVEIPDEAPEQNVQAAMVGRRVLYASENTDISSGVAQKLNNEFKAK